MARATTIFVILVALGLPSWVGAEEATLGEAAEVAARYLEYLDDRFASWGTEVSPSVSSSEELRSSGRLLGWVFHVEPEGFLVVSRHKELAAVKAWSAHGRFEIDQETGVPELVRDLMTRSVEAAESLAGRPIEEIDVGQWSSIAGHTNRESWSHSPVTAAKSRTKSGGNAGMDYEEGEALLTTNWHQGNPFNVLFPAVYYYDYDQGQVVMCREHAAVGCTATAAIQIMRHWSWPPAAADGSYVDRYWWTHMPDEVFGTSPDPEINAVSELSYNIAEALNMDYECDGSGAPITAVEDVLQNRRYHSGAHYIERCYFADCMSATDWYNLLKDQFNANRPVEYAVANHAIVGDGWYEVQVGSTTQRWYHFNYGWSGTTEDTWYLLDDLDLGSQWIDAILTAIRPDLSMGTSISGFYATEWLSANHFDRPSRYFDRDVTGSNAEFEAGQGLQYVRPGFWIRNDGITEDDEILFHGEPDAVTEFYHEAPFGDVKVRILDGTLVIRGGGEIALY